MPVTKTAAKSPVKASGSKAKKTVCQELAPMARQASITPVSNSLNTFSTKRAKKGAALATKGGIAHCTPSDVPASIRVKGIMTMSKIRKETERKTLTIKDRLW